MNNDRLVNIFQEEKEIIHTEMPNISSQLPFRVGYPLVSIISLSLAISILTMILKGTTDSVCGDINDSHLFPNVWFWIFIVSTGNSVILTIQILVYMIESITSWIRPIAILHGCFILISLPLGVYILSMEGLGNCHYGDVLCIIMISCILPYILFIQTMIARFLKTFE